MPRGQETPQAARCLVVLRVVHAADQRLPWARRCCIRDLRPQTLRHLYRLGTHQSPRHRFPLPGAEMITFSAPASMWPTAFLGKRLNKRHFCSQEESSSQRLVLNEEPCGLDNVLDAHVLLKDQWRRNLKTPHLKWLLPRQGFRALTARLDAPRSCTTKAAQT